MSSEKNLDKARKILGGSFWVIMGIHLVVFTSIGLFTPGGWGLLLLFLKAMAILAAIWGVLYLIARRHPARWMIYVPFMRHTSIFKKTTE